MPSFLTKTFSSFFNRILQFGHAGNNGTPTSTTNIEAGDGVATALNLSDDVLSVQPVNDDTTGAMLVKNQAGNNIFTVDTTNSKLLGGASQTALNTQYVHFGIGSDTAPWAGAAADTHYAIPFSGLKSQSVMGMGTSSTSSFNDTNPATTLTISASADDATVFYWYIIDNITVDSVVWFVGGDTAVGDSVAGHLMAYTLNTSGSASGNLTSGFVVANGVSMTASGYEDINFQTISPSTADVDAGSICLFTFAFDGGATSDFSINATVKYHIR